LVFCPTEDMITNTFTKPLPSTKAKHFATELGLRQPWGGVLRYQDGRSPKCSLNRERARWTEAEFTYYYICTVTCLFHYLLILWLNFYLPHHSTIIHIVTHTYYLHYSAHLSYCT
jgi:hypothetical protein